MELKVRDVSYFRSLLLCLSRFVDRAHFALTEDGFRINSIDPHDFLYVDASLSKTFFEGYPKEGTTSFVVDVSRLAKVAHLLSPKEDLYLGIQPKLLKLRGVGEWNSSYTIPWLEPDMQSLHEPRRDDYQLTLQISLRRLVEEVRRAHVISPELTFALTNRTLVLRTSSGAYHFESKPLNSLALKGDLSENIEVTVPTSYILDIGNIMNPSELCNLYLARGKPLKLEINKEDKGRVVFYLSSRAPTLENTQAASSHEALTRVYSTHFHDFITYLSGFPEGLTAELLSSSKYETKGRDYTRLGRLIGLIRTSPKVKLTRRGKQFMKLWNEDKSEAKSFLSALTLEKFHPYKIILRRLTKKPTTFDGLLDAVNASLSRSHHRKLDKEGLAVLVGLATWCGVVDRELALYYFGKGSKTKIAGPP